VQGLLDCCDGELARLRGRTGPLGVYVDRLAHYVTDGGLAVAIGVHADGGLGSIGGWTALGLLAGTLVLLSKAESDLVHVARAQAGFPRLADTIAVATSHVSLVRRLRSMARRVPFNRALLGIEMSGLALAAGVVDASSGTLAATRVLDVGLVVIGVIVVVGHLLAVMSSGRLK
jgi:phosphatidylglycerophosphate synthase